MSAYPDLDRLKSQLLVSGLQRTNNSLYQVINQLIDAFRSHLASVETSITATEESVVDLIDYEWSVLTDGDLIEPEPIYADGEVIMTYRPL